MKKISSGKATFFCGVLVVAGVTSCAAALKVKIYFSRPDLGGIYRAQDKELLKYEATEGYRCVSPSDWEAILNIVKGCNKEKYR